MTDHTMAKIHHRTSLPTLVIVTTAILALCLSFNSCCTTDAFQIIPHTTKRISTCLGSTTERPPTTTKSSTPIHHNNDNMYDRLDLSAYEESLLNQWEDTSLQTGFDWEIGKCCSCRICTCYELNHIVMCVISQ